ASLAQLQEVPGVKSATVVSPSPMDAPWTLMLFNAEGTPAPEPRGVYTAYSRVPVPGYFQRIGQPILQGRDFNASDTADSPLARANASLAAYNFLSLEDAAARSRTTERFIFVLVSSFGFVGLVLAAVGLYGLLALQVARREREFGIRSALGATARQIIQLIARQGAILLLLGFTGGALTTYGVVGLLRNQWAEMPTPNLI